MSLPRIHARVTIQAPVTVSQDGLVFGYQVSNLSVGGALISGGPALEPDTVIDVELRIDEHDPIKLTAQVLRQQLEGSSQALGIQFIETTPELEGRLTEAVTNAYRALGARVLGQVRDELHRRGVTDVWKVANTLQTIKEDQTREHMFAGELFTEGGSDTTASVVSGSTGVSRECIVWSLNLYLGLNREPRVIQRAQEALARFGTGSGTSAPSGGCSRMHHEIAERVAGMVGKQGAVLFPTGYTANLGALSALPGPRDLVLLDREAHASMIDGVKLSGCKWLTFRHNSVSDLRAKLKRYGPRHENVFVVVESAYSMSGDLAPLREIAELKQDHPFFLYVDEAHTFGFYGRGGRGLCYDLEISDSVDFLMSTFSKSTASVGGFVAADQAYCTLIQATATPYIFQACLSPPDAATILAALDEIEQHPEHAAALHRNNAYMRRRLTEEGFDLGTSQSPVLPVYVPDLEKLYQLCARLYLDGIFSVPVTYPAVSHNEGRIRFIVNARHTTAQIDRTVERLTHHARALGVIHGDAAEHAA